MAYIPHHVSALQAALRFRNRDHRELRKLNDRQWENLLRYTDMSHLTISVGRALKDDLPEWVRQRIDQNISDSATRFERIKATYREIADALEQAGVEYLVLKGFAQWPPELQDPRFRPQSDIDLYCPEGSASQAVSVLSRLGYTPDPWFIHWPHDVHLPTLTRPGDYQWSGNFFDPEMPLSVDVHPSFWNSATVHIYPEDLEHFWHRRIRMQVDELSFPALETIDSLGYSALHALRHVFYLGLLAGHIYEIATFLHKSAGDRSFWQRWRAQHGRRLRTVEAIVFSMAQQCFECEIADEVKEEIRNLTPMVANWTRTCANSALYLLFRPNKDGLWLQLSLIESEAERRALFRRSLMATRIPPTAAFEDHGATELKGTVKARAQKYTRYVKYVQQRAWYHGSQLPRLLVNGLRWWWSTKELGNQFWTFYSASFCFDLGMFVFFFLFNLYLLDRGFSMRTLGLITSAMAAGSVAGTIPAGWMAQKFGLKRTLLTCFSSVAILSALRAVFPGEVPEVSLAFLGGAASSIWAVCISPALAQLTTEKNRAFGFSLVFSFGIGEGALGGLIGGNLPGWLQRIDPSASPADLKRIALLLASALVFCACWPISRLSFSRMPAPERKVFSGQPFLPRFLVAIGLWSLVTGAFSPFFNAFFAQHFAMPIDKIGLVSAASQVSQVIAVLAAPFVFSRLGMISGIVYMQIATALALLGLARAPGAPSAAAAYISYMAFLWMSEPGMYTLLMNKMMPNERSGASALNFLVISVAQMIAAMVAGASFDRYGYPAVLSAIALVAVAAAISFRFLMGKEHSVVAESSQPVAQAASD